MTNLEAINWRDVTSSNMAAIAVDGDHLYVKFSNGAIYRYDPAAVEPESLRPTAQGLYDALAAADDDLEGSVGSVFHAVIRGKVPGEKVEQDA